MAEEVLTQPDPRLQNKYLHYDRNEVVSELLAFYKFLPHVHPSSVHEAPPGGWEMITAENLAKHNIHKSEQALDLLRHLPYIDARQPWIKEFTFVLDHRLIGNFEEKNSPNKPGWMYDLAEDWIPPWVVDLTAGSDYLGRRHMLDTTDGTVSNLHSSGYEHEPIYAKDDPRSWRDHMCDPETETLKDFLGRLKTDYRGMRTLGIPWPKDGHSTWWNNRETLHDPGPEGGEYSQYKAVRAIYVDYGWPNNYQKEDCIEALRFWQQEWEKCSGDYLEGSQHPWLMPAVFMDSVKNAVASARNG